MTKVNLNNGNETKSDIFHGTHSNLNVSHSNLFIIFNWSKNAKKTK